MVRVQTELDQNRRDADGIIKFSGKVTFWNTKKLNSGCSQVRSATMQCPQTHLKQIYK